MNNLQGIILGIVVAACIVIYLVFQHKDSSYKKWSDSCIRNGDKVIQLTTYQQPVYNSNEKTYTASFITHDIMGCTGNYKNADIIGVYDLKKS